MSKHFVKFKISSEYQDTGKSLQHNLIIAHLIITERQIHVANIAKTIWAGKTSFTQVISKGVISLAPCLVVLKSNENVKQNLLFNNAFNFST